MNNDVNYFVGIDLGSTTTKAVFMTENERVLGRGITNSRSNYAVACQVASEEAEIGTRFILLEDSLKRLFSESRVARPFNNGTSDITTELMDLLSHKFALAKHLKQLTALRQECFTVINTWTKTTGNNLAYRKVMEHIFSELEGSAQSLFLPGSGRAQSDFFRDIATSLFLKQAEVTLKEITGKDAANKDKELSFDRVIGVFDKAILRVENQSFAKYYAEYLDFAGLEILKLEKFQKYATAISEAVKKVAQIKFNIVSTVGTGYGRLTLPFPKDQIRSEILCHGLGAHTMFPLTRTVLDIGGQDTKAIQVDENGIVTGFQMNDRCAAGCGRYLGYIADEMNMGVHQLGPLAMQSRKPAKINSTCTVFAGAELRERLSLGEKREDILAGLHRAIILRAMSLLARSGGLFSEFTFTGGVALNEAATNVLRALVQENYGEIKINISHDSIYTGALGAALFAVKCDRHLFPPTVR